MKTRKHEQQESDLPPKIGNPARRALEGEGYFRLGQLTKVAESELMKLHGMGPNALGMLKDALKAKGLSFARSGGAGSVKTKKASEPVGKTKQVDEFMAKLDHPFKAEVQAVREIIKNANKDITEEIKWNAPSFSYKGYMATFNLWAKQHVHLIFHNGAILNDKSGLLQGDYVDRRMVYFSNMEDVESKKDTLEKVIRQWIKLMNKQKEKS